MALIACAECGKEVSTQAAACPSCGAKVKKPSSGLWFPAILLLLFGFLLAVASGKDSAQQEKATAQYAIENCWSEYEKKSMGPAEKRFIAGACEKMEAGFKQQYGHRP